MGLDMRPMGKPKLGFEKRFIEIFEIIEKNEFEEPTFFQKLLGKKVHTKENLLNEWFENILPTYETIKAPMVGRDQEANDWAKENYEKINNKPAFEEYINEMNGFYVIEKAKELDGVPVYMSPAEDENVFRGQFMQDCVDLIGEDLVNEAWVTKLAEATLDYGNRLMAIADKIAKERGLQYLKEQRMPPENDEASVESKLHIVYSLAKWLIFYGRNGHGYEAYY